ncbi:FliM/FliN family flagellar motor switch protein [Pseudoalteromonas marina]|uniref:Flagellar motor switch protein FliN n=1 Tax=Pseudoalteromonas marina TaxID=267375 RepID=A0ABT9FC32_9GAMM|nr:FliM/FliN family flagellar motor switch protein [Pseudoalteromonas marina]MDP2564330.1 FliM/FliN family flagellar motor switch protein [Pseudoalteromonas marina]
MSNEDDFPSGFDDMDQGADSQPAKQNTEAEEDAALSSAWDEALADSCSERDKIVSSPSQTSGMVDVNNSEVRMQEIDDLAQSVVSGAAVIDQNIVNDIEIEVQIVAGSTKMRLGDLLKLNQGSAIETTSLKDAPFLLLCNGKKVGSGDLCFINDSRGIKLTELVSDNDRLLNKKNI